MNPYPTYKDSGLPWLGPIPEHWTVLPLKYFLGINRETLPENTPGDYAIEYLDISNVGSTGVIGPADRLAFKDAPSRARRIVKPGDTVISTVRTYLKAIAHIDNCSHNLVASTGFAVLTPRKGVLPRYISYVVHGYAFINQVTAESKGVNYPAITSVELGNIKITTVADLSEQAAIVAYLDRKTADIERFITKKRQLIALLNEQKAAIINQAVTKGLNPDAPMKDSGVEWLGEVPAHWQVRRNGASFAQRVEPGDKELPILVVSLHTGVTVGEEDKDDPKRLIEDRTQYKRTCKGDIAYNMMRMWQGAVGVVPVDGLVSPAYVVARPLPGTDSRFFNYLFRTDFYKNEVNRQSRGIVPDRNRLYWADFKQMLSPHPPPDEQQQIVQEIERRCQHIEVAITRIEREVELINEYRTTLISEAVTGKIDVREAAGSLTT